MSYDHGQESVELNDAGNYSDEISSLGKMSLTIVFTQLILLHVRLRGIR